tara:strand:+ start:83 stop:334 length:252 start_codon:yes stop_codon:yes gene_type:complete
MCYKGITGKKKCQKAAKSKLPALNVNLNTGLAFVVLAAPRTGTHIVHRPLFTLSISAIFVFAAVFAGHIGLATVFIIGGSLHI